MLALACPPTGLSQAAYLAERYDAELHVLHVAEPSMVLPPLDLTEADVAAELHLPPPADPPVYRTDDGLLRNIEVSPVGGSVERAILAYAADEPRESLPQLTAALHDPSV